VTFFPYDTLEAQIAKPERWTPSPNEPPTEEAAATTKKDSSDPMVPTHLTVPKVTAETNPLKKIDLASALQYGQAQGYPPLLSWVQQFTRQCLHPNVPYRGGPEVTLTVGSTDGFAKTLELFVNPWSPAKDDIRDRPALLCETFIYSNVLAQAEPKGIAIVPIKADDGGMCVEGDGGLEDVLSNWDESKGKRPHLMYTVT
jgi:DNA-binding transcriptional MocR family regulator